jgi:hypothetical protein
VNTWRPEAGINFAKTATKRHSEVGKELSVPSTNEGTGESRIDKIRRLLSEQRDRVPRKGEQTASAKSKAARNVYESQEKTAVERKRRSPDASSSAAKRSRIEHRPGA